MTNLISKSVLSLSFMAAAACASAQVQNQNEQGDIWRDINGVRDVTLDSLNIANQARPVSGSTRKGNNPVLFLIGNSTMRNGTLGNGNNGQWGWGYFAHNFFDDSKITVENHALGGTSPRTFYNQLWQPVLKGIRPGDYVVLELGHNDNGPIDSLRARSSYKGVDGKSPLGNDSIEVTIKETGRKEVVYTFGGYVRKFVNDIRNAGATPILLTLTPRNAYEESDTTKIQRKLTTFTPWIKALAEELHTPFIDLNDISAKKLESYGPWKTDYHFFGDKIHSSEFGAKMNAASYAEGLAACTDPQIMQLKGCLLENKVVPQRCDQNRQKGKPVVFLCGDSTGKNADKDEDGMWGWGSQGYTVFNEKKCTFVNAAKAGRSTRTFLAEDRWETVYNSLQPGDYVLIQFGHNDIGGIDKDKERGVIATANDTCHVYKLKSTGEYKVIYSFGWYIRKMVRDAQEKGAHPVVLSFTPRNEWHAGKGETRGTFYPVFEKEGKQYIERRNDNYIPMWDKQVAEECGAEFVDVHNITADALDKMGKDKAAAMFNHDHTHTSKAGAQLNAKSVAKGLKAIKSPLSKLLK